MLENIFYEISAERKYQQGKWGDDFDSKNTPNDWVAYLTKYVGQSV